MQGGYNSHRLRQFEVFKRHRHRAGFRLYWAWVSKFRQALGRAELDKPRPDSADP